MRFQQMFINKKYNNSTLYTLTRDMSYASAGQNHIGSNIVKHACILKPENKNNWVRIIEEPHYCMLLLLQQYGLVLVNICNLEF